MRTLVGLASVTFRKKSPEEVIGLVCRAGLDGVEWGGDVHVPPGNIPAARAIEELTRRAGVQTPSYGSYYAAGEPEDASRYLSAVFDTASALGASRVRVWAGRKGSGEADSAYRRGVIETLQKAGVEADARGMIVTIEFHSHTLTDSAESAVSLIKDVGHSAVRLTWQVPIGMPESAVLASLEKVRPWLVGLHVFWWIGYERRPLREGLALWRKCFEMVRDSGGPLWSFLEFVKDDSVEQLLDDASVLKDLAREAAA